MRRRQHFNAFRKYDHRAARLEEEGLDDAPIVADGRAGPATRRALGPLGTPLFKQVAKDMLASIGASVQTSYGTKKKTPKSK